MRILTIRCGLFAALCLIVTLTVTQAQTETEVVEMVDGNNAFAFDLYHAVVAQEDGNIVFSPHSLFQALAMTYAGARGQTEQQMADTLHFTLPQATLHPAFRALNADLTARAEVGDVAESRPLQLHLVNALWRQEGFPFYPEFLALVEENYSASLIPVDFAGAPEESRLRINDWAAEETGERVTDLVPEGIITPLTRLVLTNAIYFNATWLYPFDEMRTDEGAFTLLDGSLVETPMMGHEQFFLNAVTEDYVAVELPYYSEDTAMLIVMPPLDRFGSFESGLSPATFAAIVQSLETSNIFLRMPRFEYDFDLNLSDTLAEMGMPDAFDAARADFTGMAPVTPVNNLYVTAVLHKAFIGVDEYGTEAAAASAVVVALRGLPPAISIDHPFIFIIYDKPTRSILFIGRVVNPAE